MTRKIMLIAGVAMMAISAPATADPKGERGARAERPQRAERQQEQRAERPQRAARQEQRAERPQRAERQELRAERPQRVARAQRAERPQFRQAERAERRELRRVERPQRVERQESRLVERPQRVDRPQRMDRAERRELRAAERPQRVERQERRQVERFQRAERHELRRAERPQRVEREQIRRAERSQPRENFRDLRAERRELREARRDDRPLQRIDQQRSAGQWLRQRREMRPMRDLAERRERIRLGERLAATAYAPVPAFYGDRYRDTNDYYHRYDDDYGYVYRVDRDDHFVSALYPMFGGYSAGDPWPSMYRSSYVPYGYQGYYYDTPDYHYRYDGNAIYRIDAGSQLISGIVALLLGQSLGVGQTLPASYSAYNLPLAYRANYVDSDDSWYRYGDGFIYEVDPYSRRIEQRYPLYADNFYVGQQWPVAYPDYNIPDGYQDVYFDTPQDHYRYANGGIYRVDPSNQLITALVALLSGQQFGIGQAMPAGYSSYNVPYAYRDQYADSDRDWYRYADGYVYRVDPLSGLIEEAYPIYT